MFELTGEDLTNLRKKAGLTQADVARTLNVTQSRIAEMEKDPSGTSLRRVLSFLEAVGVRMSIMPIDDGDEEE